MNAPTKNIVFDWNSTLLDDVDALHIASSRLLELEGHAPITLEAFQSHYTIPLENLYKNLGFNETQIAKMLHLENTSFHDNYEPLADRAPLREGAVDLLTYARHHDIYALILSNHLVDPIRVQLRRLEIDHLLNEVLAYADRVTQFKDMTKGERLRRFMADRDMTPEHTMIVGDTIEEIHIGREQGLISIAITGGCASEARLRAEKPDYLIHSLNELKSILRERGFAP